MLTQLHKARNGFCCNKYCNRILRSMATTKVIGVEDTGIEFVICESCFTIMNQKCRGNWREYITTKLIMKILAERN